MVDWIPKDQMPASGAMVYESPVLDGVGLWVQNRVNPISSNKTTDQIAREVKQIIADTGVEIIVSYLPVGSDKVTKFWAQICLDTGTAFVNCIPSFIASDKEWAKNSRKKTSPASATTSRAGGGYIYTEPWPNCATTGGQRSKRTYQINVGGNTDFLNMKEQDRLISKKISKTESVQSQLDTRLDDDQIYVGPSDFIPSLKTQSSCS